jgi:hypothetical protein
MILYFYRSFINTKVLSTRYMVDVEVNYRELFATSYRRSMKYNTQDLLGIEIKMMCLYFNIFIILCFIAYIF